MIERLPCSSEFAAHPLVLGAAEELLLPHTKKIQFKVTHYHMNRGSLDLSDWTVFAGHRDDPESAAPS